MCESFKQKARFLVVGAIHELPVHFNVQRIAQFLIFFSFCLRMRCRIGYGMTLSIALSVQRTFEPSPPTLLALPSQPCEGTYNKESCSTIFSVCPRARGKWRRSRRRGHSYQPSVQVPLPLTDLNCLYGQFMNCPYLINDFPQRNALQLPRYNDVIK